jgi:hypothetical protein
MLNLRLRPALARLVDPVADALLRAKVPPDAITVAGPSGWSPARWSCSRRAGSSPAPRSSSSSS